MTWLLFPSSSLVLISLLLPIHFCCFVWSSSALFCCSLCFFTCKSLTKSCLQVFPLLHWFKRDLGDCLQWRSTSSMDGFDYSSSSTTFLSLTDFWLTCWASWAAVSLFFPIQSHSLFEPERPGYKVALPTSLRSKNFNSIRFSNLIWLGIWGSPVRYPQLANGGNFATNWTPRSEVTREPFLCSSPGSSHSLAQMDSSSPNPFSIIMTSCSKKFIPLPPNPVNFAEYSLVLIVLQIHQSLLNKLFDVGHAFASELKVTPLIDRLNDSEERGSTFHVMCF